MDDTIYESFDTFAGFQAAIERLLAETGRELRIFDPDGSALRLNDAARVGALERFLRASRNRRLFMVVHEPQHLQRDCPRMMALLARYGHAMQIHRTQEEIRDLQDAFLVLDSVHYVRRPAAAVARGAIGLRDETEALAMRSRFNEIWSASYPAVSATTIGL
jgi:hypothetical protein